MGKMKILLIALSICLLGSVVWGKDIDKELTEAAIMGKIGINQYLIIKMASLETRIEKLEKEEEYEIKDPIFKSADGCLAFHVDENGNQVPCPRYK